MIRSTIRGRTIRITNTHTRSVPARRLATLTSPCRSSSSKKYAVPKSLALASTFVVAGPFLLQSGHFCSTAKAPIEAKEGMRVQLNYKSKIVGGTEVTLRSHCVVSHTRLTSLILMLGQVSNNEGKPPMSFVVSIATDRDHVN
jgi:hypothetical protein